jgi:hypothetical protein
MRILSFDIGIRHLSYCILEKEEDNLEIIAWEVVDMFKVDTKIEWIELGCLRHMCKQWDRRTLHKWLEDRGEKEIPKLKIDSYKMVDKHLANLGAIKISPTDIQIIAAKMYCFLDLHPEFRTVNTVLLENQPCMKNPTMKSVQVLLFSYFLLERWRGNVPSTTEIRLIAAGNKLKVYTRKDIEVEVKNKYRRSKLLSIEHAKRLLENHDGSPVHVINSDPWLLLLKDHSKKDDLSDSFLQAVYITLPKNKKKKSTLPKKNKTLLLESAP